VAGIRFSEVAGFVRLPLQRNVKISAGTVKFGLYSGRTGILRARFLEVSLYTNVLKLNLASDMCMSKMLKQKQL
jgi:hypothetical protein